MVVEFNGRQWTRNKSQYRLTQDVKSSPNAAISHDRYFIPMTPYGTLCEELISSRFTGAVRNLKKAASHKKYLGWAWFYQKGYRIYKLDGDNLIELGIREND